MRLGVPEYNLLAGDIAGKHNPIILYNWYNEGMEHAEISHNHHAAKQFGGLEQNLAGLVPIIDAMWQAF